MAEHYKADVLRDLRVLHVEDDAIIQFSVTSMFQSLVKAVYRANDGHEGLEIYRMMRPDVVIADILTPRMNGLEMVEAIREIDQDVQIIIATAYSETGYLLKSIEYGVDKYVIKPIDRLQLLDALCHCGEKLHQRRLVDESDRFTRFLLDMQPNFVMTLQNGMVEYINAPFLNFLGYDGQEEFHRSVARLGDIIETFDSSTDKAGLEAWLTLLGNTAPVFADTPAPGGAPQQTVLSQGPVVTFKAGPGQAFVASVNTCDQARRTVVNFTDITRLEAEKRHWVDMASTDHLTGVMNRAKFLAVLDEELQRAQRYRSPLNCMMFDVDDFKGVNDTFGHDVGDRVLQGICELVGRNIRKHDRLARWGGEEFILLAPGCSERETALLAEKLRRMVEAQSFEGPGRVTCSFGLTSYKPGEPAEALLKRVDQAMYKAKHHGKNSVATL